MGFKIEDERTRGERIARPQDKEREDVLLLVLGGPEAGKRFLVKPPGGVLGRQPGCVIQLEDPDISRRHALLEFTGDGRVMITDLGSKSGVFVNGARIARAEIFDGNNLQVTNDTVLRVRFQDPAETELLDELWVGNIKDSVTALPNRRYLSQRLGQELAYARRHSEPLSVVMLDIDDFHKVNEADGRAAGDALLRAIAELLRGGSRAEDVVGRYGSDQYLVVLRGTGEAEAKVYAERMRKSCRSRTFDVGDVPLRISLSVGVASFQPGGPEVEDLQKLLDRADSAVYRAKSGGKNRVEPWVDESVDGEEPKAPAKAPTPKQAPKASKVPRPTRRKPSG
jgi:diguanylate cyclase (GGDEF)-like protein